MLISKVVYDSTGNGVANYTEYIYKCTRCKGEGWLSSEDYLTVVLNGSTECPDCSGMGTTVVRK